MAANLDNLKEGTFIRFSMGRAVSGRKVFQRAYTGGVPGLAEILTDYTLPSIGDEYDAQYPQLRVVDADMKVQSTDRTTGASIVHIQFDYIDMSEIHVDGGSTTATVQTPFDSDGNRITVSREGDEYVALIDVEEARSYLLVERVLTFAPEIEEIATWVKERVNRVNDDTFLGEPARCWRVARIEYELLFERIAFGNVNQKVYRVRIYAEHRPARDVELVAGESLETVAGWDAIVAYEADGVVPADAIFTVKQRYTEIDFATQIFYGITF